MSDLRHECGVAALYHFSGVGNSPLCSQQGPDEVSRLMPRMLLDLQNRGQLAAGMTTFSPRRHRLLKTHRELGGVSEVFRLNHRGKAESLMSSLAGTAAIGHVRYATCGQDDVTYAHPFEREHIKKHKWFSFCFNGQLANYAALRRELVDDDDNHLSRDTDSEIIMHSLSRALSDGAPDLYAAWTDVFAPFDGAYSLAAIDALGRMIVVRDALGVKPMCYATDGRLLAVASESVALLNIGFEPSSIQSLEPGAAIVADSGGFRIEQFQPSPRRAHCFFEWIYFANVASTLDGRSVYLSRKALGEELARLEDVVTDDGADVIVAPVPDTSKAAADSMAYALGVPCVEGLIRNRYMGRTFIEGGGRRDKVRMKYTPLREVLEGKRVILVEDSIVRSTTLRELLTRLKEYGRAKEVHVRVACPPIVAPCFYGIDMSTVDELFAPPFLQGGLLTRAGEDRMAAELGADSLRYLPIEAISRAVVKPADELCQACITGEYPTDAGRELYQIALEQVGGGGGQRTLEQPTPASL